MKPTARPDARHSREFDFRSLSSNSRPEIVEKSDSPFAHYCPVVRQIETF
jgi:hypothetical protein